jgi:8-oxo-dGTP pyrophosphatase MutT (NUDIX family)
MRELGEETELDVARLRVGPCLLVEEQRFLQRGKPRHELNVVFHVEHGFAAAGDGPPPAVKPRESHIDFEWVHADRLDGIHLRPPVLAAWLRGVIEQGAPAGDVRPLWRSIEAEHDVHEPR